MSKIDMTHHMKILGCKVRDVVTGFEGIVATVGFDLYGCVQCVVTPEGVDKEGKTKDGHWFDSKRLTVLNKKPVLPPPEFTMSTADIPGGYDKPLPR